MPDRSWAARTFAALSSPDKLALAFIAGVGSFAALRGAATALDLALLSAQAAAIVGVALWGIRSRAAAHVHAFFPVVIVIGLFETIGPLIATLNPQRFDAELARMDAHWFGSLPEAWFHVLGRPTWLTDLASVLYLGFYPLPVVIAVVLYLRRRREAFDLFATTVVATFLASYVGYFVWPAIGPRVPRELEAMVLGGGAVSAAVRDFMHIVEQNRLDAFPSGHAAVAIATLVRSWQSLPLSRVAVVAVIAGILFATVYLSLHYVVDLVAGILLGLTVSTTVQLLHRRYGHGPGR